MSRSSFTDSKPAWASDSERKTARNKVISADFKRGSALKYLSKCLLPSGFQRKFCSEKGFAGSILTEKVQICVMVGSGML